jgi:hypothetical protein
MAVITDKNREELRAAEDGSPMNFDDELAQMKYRLAASRNLRAQLELHRAYLAGAIARMRSRALGRP